MVACVVMVRAIVIVAVVGAPIMRKAAMKVTTSAMVIMAKGSLTLYARRAKAFSAYGSVGEGTIRPCR